jgi:hypothetical protein
VLGKPRLAPEARDVADRDDKVIVFELVGPRTKAGARRHGLVFEVDRLHLPRVEIGVRTESADRRDRVEDSDAPRNDLRQHRLKHKVVLLADQPHLDARIVSQKLLERDGRVDAAEAPADDEDSRSLLIHH